MLVLVLIVMQMPQVYLDDNKDVGSGFVGAVADGLDGNVGK